LVYLWGSFCGVVVSGKLSVYLVFKTPGCYIFNPLHPQELNTFFYNQKLRLLPNEVTSASRGFQEYSRY